MKSRPGLRKRLTVGVLLYVVVVALVVAVHGYIVNERVERLLWESLLESELARIAERRAEDPNYRWVDTETLKLYGPTSNPPPAEFAALSEGVHDEVGTEGRQFVTLVRQSEQGKEILALDISGIERSERRLTWMMVGPTAIVAAFLALITHFGAGWLVRPLSSMARVLSTFAPDRAGQRLVVERSAPREAEAIAAAFNDYLQRLDRFVERERAFVNMASHELRTPIAVISGSAEVALDLDGISPASEPYLRHILRTARDMERLVALLVALAKDPVRLRASGEIVNVADLLPLIVADHEFLAKRKELSFELDVAIACSITAPAQIVRAAVGNLVRNAIENSDRGVVKVSTASSAKIIIADPGHGMTAEEMTAVYTRVARSGEFVGTAGIGIDLISRLCEHFGWRLSFASTPDKGTTATLDFAVLERPAA